MEVETLVTVVSIRASIAVVGVIVRTVAMAAAHAAVASSIAVTLIHAFNSR
jgi:hypothetical protein